MASSVRVRRVWFGAAVISFAALGAWAWLGWTRPESPALAMGREDGPVETLGAVLWGLAAVLALARLAGGGWGRRGLLALWGVFAFICMGEEVSWFQRVVGVETPAAIAAVNGQQELNLHNLSPIDFGPVFNVQQLFHVGFLAWFLLLPLALTLRPRWRSRLAAWAGYLRPDAVFLATVWALVGGSYLLQGLVGGPAARVLAEARETVFALAGLGYVALFLPRERRGPARLFEEAVTAPVRFRVVPATPVLVYEGDSAAHPHLPTHVYAFEDASGLVGTPSPWRDGPTGRVVPPV